jgi:ribokinase
LTKSVRNYTGGSATNTSVGFSKLGLKVAAVCSIGVGNNSERVMGNLKENGVDTRFVERKKNQRTGFSIILNAKHKDRTIFAFKGSNDLLCKDCMDDKALYLTKWMYFGSLMGKSFETFKKLVKMCHEKGIKVAFNPSHYLAKQGTKMLGEVLSYCDVVILNKEEAQVLFKQKDVMKCLKGFHKLGVEVSVITDGSGTIHAYDGFRCYTVKPHKINVVETTGAGDAFATGFVGALVKGLSVGDAIPMGLSNSQSVITHFGAKDKLLSWDEVQVAVKKAKYKVVAC